MAHPHLFTSILLLILSPSTSSTLDPKQLTALQSMGLPTAHDPCSPNATANSTNATTACDSATPFRHLIALSLSNCSGALDVSPTALRSLVTLRSLSLSLCAAPLLARRPLPAPLAASLRSFTALRSLPRLSGVWLSRLSNLSHLRLSHVPVSASGPFVFLSHMPLLLSARVSACNLSGQLPHHWRSLNLSLLDLSSNRLRGAVPASIGSLSSLQLLNLSSNSLAGALPESIGELPELASLDLGSNRFNGSLPGFLARMGRLRFLNLEDNDFQGVMPFNASFIRRLDVFKIGGNANLCYNRSLIPARMRLGIAPCDKYGAPASPPPGKSSESGWSDDGGGDGDDDGSDDDGGGGDGGEGGRKSSGDHHGPNKLVLGVAIGLSCLVFLVIFIVCFSKCCGG